MSQKYFFHKIGAQRQKEAEFQKIGENNLEDEPIRWGDTAELQADSIKGTLKEAEKSYYYYVLFRI